MKSGQAGLPQRSTGAVTTHSSDSSTTHDDSDSGADPSVDRIVILGRIAGPFGVQGWVKVISYTEPPANILEYETLLLGGSGPQKWRPVQIEDGRVTGKGVLAKLSGVESPEDARTWVGCELGIRRSEMPEPAPGEYYWSDLEGFEAVTPGGELLGTVDHFRETPTGAVIVVRGEREHWIPFVKERIAKVAMAERRIVLDWPADW